MIAAHDLTTADPLGIGGLLADAYRLEQRMRGDASGDERLLMSMLAAALSGLEYFVRQGDPGQTADRRLAFRELGLAIGLHGRWLHRGGAQR